MEVISWLVLAATFLLAGPSRARGQDAGDGGLRIAVGAAGLGIADDVASRLSYHGRMTGIAVSYDGRGPESRWSIEGAYHAGELTSSIASDGGVGVGTEDARTGWLSLEYLRAAWEPGSVRVLIGGRVDARVAWRTHHYAPWGEELYADLLAPLEAAMAGVWALGEGVELSERVAVPVMALILRDPWTGAKYAPSPRLGGPLSVRGVDHELTYRRAVSARWHLDVTHRLTYLRHSDDPALTLVHHGMTIGLRWVR